MGTPGGPHALTKSRGWSWLREAVGLGHGGELSLKSLIFGPFCMKMDKRLSALGTP